MPSICRPVDISAIVAIAYFCFLSFPSLVASNGLGHTITLQKRDNVQNTPAGSCPCWEPVTIPNAPTNDMAWYTITDTNVQYQAGSFSSSFQYTVESVKSPKRGFPYCQIQNLTTTVTEVPLRTAAQITACRQELVDHALFEMDRLIPDSNGATCPCFTGEVDFNDMCGVRRSVGDPFEFIWLSELRNDGYPIRYGNQYRPGFLYAPELECRNVPERPIGTNNPTANQFDQHLNCVALIHNQCKSKYGSAQQA